MENKIEIIRNMETHFRSSNIQIHEIPNQNEKIEKKKSLIKYSRKLFHFQIKGGKSAAKQLKENGILPCPWNGKQQSIWSSLTFSEQSQKVEYSGQQDMLMPVRCYQQNSAGQMAKFFNKAMLQDWAQ